jgi:hypothetical protein
MKKLVVALVGLAIIAGLVLGPTVLSAATAPAPNVVMGTPIVKMDSKVCRITIMGSGFKAGDSVNMILKTPDGVFSDVTPSLSPAPKANEVGAWATVFDASVFVGKKIIGQGMYTLQVTDADYNTLANVPFGLYDPAAPDKWPDWVKANVPAPAPAPAK